MAAGMRQTMRDHGFQFLGQIARQSVAHLDGRFQARRPLRVRVLKVMTGGISFLWGTAVRI
jgi:hypothetical protein